MSSKKTKNVGDSSSANLKNSEEFEPNSEVRLNRKFKKTTKDLNVPKKKKKLSNKCLFTSICEGTKIKICAINPDKKSSVENEDDTQICRKSINSQSIKQNSPTNDSVKAGKIKQKFEISSGSDMPTTNDIISPKKKKNVSKKCLFHSTPVVIKRQTFDVSSNFNTSVVHKEDSQGFLSPLEDLKQIEDTKQSIQATSESCEILTTNDLSLPLPTEIVSKKRVLRKRISTFIGKNKKISKVNIKKLSESTTKSDSENVVHKVATQGFISPLEDLNKIEDTEQSIQATSESCEILTTNDLSLSLPTEIVSKKRVSRSTFIGKNKKISKVNIKNLSESTTKSDSENVVHKVATQGFISPLEDLNKIEDTEQSIQATSESCEILTTNDFSLSLPTEIVSKKRVSRSTFIGKNKKISKVNIKNLSESTTKSDSENVVRKVATQRFISPLEDLNKIEDTEQSIQATSESCEILTTNDLSLSLPTEIVSKKRVSRSTFIGKNKKISKVNIKNLSESTTKSDSENVVRKVATQGFISPLEDLNKIEGTKQSIQATSGSCEIVSTNDLNLLLPTEVVTKKRVSRSTFKGKKKKKSNVNVKTIPESTTISNSENVHKVATQGFISSLEDFKKIEEVVSKKRVSCSTFKGKNKKISNVNIKTLSESITNITKSNSEIMNINEMQPVVMVELLSDSLLKKLSIKRVKTTDENFGGDQTISKITGQHSKPAEIMLKEMDSDDSFSKRPMFRQHSKPADTMLKIKNGKVLSRKRSLIKSTSRFGRKIKPTKYVDYVEGSSIPKHSKLNAKQVESSEENYDGNSETNNLLEGTHEINDTISNVKIMETTKNLVPSSQSIKYFAAERIQVNIEENNNISAVLNDSVNNCSSPNIDWMKVDADNELLNLLEVEVDLLDCILNLRSALRLSHVNYEMALESLYKLLKLNINAVMLKKNRDVIDTIIKVSQYIGNVREWNLSEQEILEHVRKACQIRDKARLVLNWFKSFFTVPDGKIFQEVFDKEVEDFMAKTKDKTCP